MVTCSSESGAGVANRPEHKDALLYGAGDAKIGSIIGKGAKAGKELKARFFKNLPALGKLLAAVKKAARRGYIVGLDGRKVYIRSEHAALNTLLQSAGALTMKRAMVFADAEVKARGWEKRAFLIGSIHDENQWECDPEIAEELGEVLRQCIVKAGKHFNLRCELDGEFAVGNNWSETH